MAPIFKASVFKSGKDRVKRVPLSSKDQHHPLVPLRTEDQHRSSGGTTHISDTEERACVFRKNIFFYLKLEKMYSITTLF